MLCSTDLHIDLRQLITATSVFWNHIINRIVRIECRCCYSILLHLHLRLAERNHDPLPAKYKLIHIAVECEVTAFDLIDRICIYRYAERTVHLDIVADCWSDDLEERFYGSGDHILLNLFRRLCLFSGFCIHILVLNVVHIRILAIFFAQAMDLQVNVFFSVHGLISAKSALRNFSIVPCQRIDHISSDVVNHNSIVCIFIFHKCSCAQRKSKLYKLITFHKKIIFAQDHAQLLVIRSCLNSHLLIQQKVRPVFTDLLCHTQLITFLFRHDTAVIQLVMMKFLHIVLIPFQPLIDMTVCLIRRNCIFLISQICLDRIR